MNFDVVVSMSASVFTMVAALKWDSVRLDGTRDVFSLTFFQLDI